MRDYKFRAWDNVNSRMLYFGGFCWHDEYDLCYIDGKLDVPAKDNLEWMQFTGLKDKNGKEIYDGDVLEKAGIRWRVMWYKEGARFILWKIEKQKKVFDGCLPAPITMQEYLVREMSVVGNVYENPELLTP